ncbi:NHLP bacteriocin system secretion protein [Trinickia dinghuensis]|uniref:NHLP bacteriocin system secretion protein n=1 Tax=Trinickia dinghuensis TaxID=2291023 RepID=A0A3D8JSU9_9BURK|nr:NHLP bacteriocin system secretion protein [Trinickia dinghuensis]RDU95491.1 NHLP bacteriocin system secretion protein [Trinickia dinghuensis]
MPSPLFRDAALQNLASPEQLDQVIRITRPRAWIALLILGLVLVAVFSWSLLGSLPSTIQGQGLLIRQGGTYNIVATGGGVLTAFDGLQPGQAVHKGQVLAGIAQPLLTHQRDAARTELRQLEMERDGMEKRQPSDPLIPEFDARILSARHRLDDVTAQLSLNDKVVSPYDGVVVEVLANQGDVVAANQPLLSVEGAQRSLEALIYVPPRSEAAAIRPGMAVQLSPATARKERYGYLAGKVRSVSKYPSTERGMLAVVDNPGLVRQLSSDGPPVAVTVDLIPDATTRSGYRWSSRAASELDLNSGTLASASVTVEVQKPISLVIPLLKRAGGL